MPDVFAFLNPDVLTLLNITDDQYADASRIIAAELTGYGMDVSTDDVNAILRRYVLNGATTTTQLDYGNANSTAKYDEAHAIADAKGYTYDTVANVLNQLTLHAADGTIDERIAYPRKWADQIESGLRQSAADTTAKHANDPGVLDKGIYDFANALSSGVLRAVEGAAPLVLLGGLAFILSTRPPAPQRNPRRRRRVR